METLEEISRRHDGSTDKGLNAHGYVNLYSSLFEPYRDTADHVLEIGVNKGGSLRLWDDYFTKAHISGIDIEERCFKYPKFPRTSLYIRDQSDSVVMTKFGEEHGLFDIVIDDGSHIWDHQITSFQSLWPFVKPGGLYVVEDVLTSYGNFLPEYRGGNISAVEYFKAMVDELNYYGDERATDPRVEIRRNFAYTENQKSVSWIMFQTNLIVIKKRGGGDEPIGPDGL